MLMTYFQWLERKTMLKNIKCTCTCDVENENKVYFLDVTVTKEEVALTALFKRKPVVVYI